MVLYCVVVTKCNQKVIVRSDWIDVKDSSETWNYGLKKSKLLKFFYSPSGNEANFNLEIKARFDCENKEDGCYEGRVLRSYGKIV